MGKNCSTDLYGLKTIVALGFRMKGLKCEAFRKWAALAAGVVSAVAIVVVNMGFEPKEFKALIKRVTGIIRK